MNRLMPKLLCATLVTVLSLAAAGFASAHHVLGRPSYGLNEDSNTPPAVQGETHLGSVTATYMVFPAFPKPEEPGRINLYLKQDRSDVPFEGKVTFKIRSNSWLSWLWNDEEEITLGTQLQDDSVFRQVFVFPKEGEYIISAEFEADGLPYNVEFPLRIGALMPMDFILGFALLVLVGFVVIQRRRSMTGKIRNLHADGSKA
ncbi:MAG: hypothetical protein GKS00_17515 [Alphaproteobacteria bacterium]|nr:hypothetical protein [Alphaproteobacteria bacterium]